MRILRYLTVFLIALYFPTTQASTLEDVLSSGLRYLQNTQVKTTKGQLRFKGEWPAFMMNDHDIQLLGKKGKIAYDSNCFNTAGIYNSLAEIYKRFPEYSFLSPILESAIDNVLMYERNGLFGFWPMLPRPNWLYPIDYSGNKPLVRLPNHYHLDNLAGVNAANVPEDADDTAVAYLALKNHNELAAKKLVKTTRLLPNPDFDQVFNRFRDKGRLNAHYYNIVHGFRLFTGAYMTWLHKEKFINPWSWLPIKTDVLDKPYIPWGANEVDCVVNANVLNTLANFNKAKGAGVERSCRFINRSIKRKQFAYCGLYYPNHYHIHYVTAKALKSGANCLEPSRDRLVDHIMSSQSEDGSFASKSKKDLRWKFIKRMNKNSLLDRVNDRYFRKSYTPKDSNEYDISWLNTIDPEDKLQSTAYALSALIKLTALKSDLAKTVFNRGLAYLLSQKKVSKSGNVYWKGGVFFAGGTIVRDDLRWRSDAYTTALVLELISEKLKL